MRFGIDTVIFCIYDNWRGMKMISMKTELERLLERQRYPWRETRTRTLVGEGLGLDKDAGKTSACDVVGQVVLLLTVLYFTMSANWSE